jgi:hypothetical protein
MIYKNSPAKIYGQQDQRTAGEGRMSLAWGIAIACAMAALIFFGVIIHLPFFG